MTSEPDLPSSSCTQSCLCFCGAFNTLKAPLYKQGEQPRCFTRGRPFFMSTTWLESCRQCSFSVWVPILYCCQRFAQLSKQAKLDRCIAFFFSWNTIAGCRSKREISNAGPLLFCTVQDANPRFKVKLFKSTCRKSNNMGKKAETVPQPTPAH